MDSRGVSMDSRGVSAVVSYALILGIVALLTSALFVGFAPFVANQQQATVHSTLEVLGNDVAGDVAAADRLAARAGDGGAVELRTRLPDRVGGSRYEIEVEQVGGSVSEITLRSDDPEVSATTRVRTRATVRERTGPDRLRGGSLEIVYDPADDELVIRNA